jgi:hypothetical protein
MIEQMHRHLKTNMESEYFNNRKKYMKIFIMAILLGQIDPAGNVFYTPWDQNPRLEFNTLEKCLDASKIKGDEMYASSKNYPELGIVHIKIDCIETKESKRDTI